RVPLIRSRQNGRERAPGLPGRWRRGELRRRRSPDSGNLLVRCPHGHVRGQIDDAEAPSARHPIGRKRGVGVRVRHKNKVVDADFAIGAVRIMRADDSGNGVTAEDPDGLGTGDGAAVGDADLGAGGALGLRAVEGTFVEGLGGRVVMIDG
ncbi:MAG: hypothetical protein Q9187_004781, partial [Circinaria calcarea]